MKKVIHLISTDVFSGAENVACQIISYFSNNEEFDEMLYVSKIGKNEESLKQRNISTYALDKFNYKEIKKAINKIKPDVIHAHDIRASIFASLFHKKAKIVSHIHANHENMRKVGAKTILFKLASKNIDKIFWVSQSALDNYIYKNKIMNKSEVLYNVISKEEIVKKIKLDKNKYGNYDLIYLGRLTYQKNPIRLLEIIKKIKNIKSDIKVAIVGSGEFETQVKEYIKQYDLHNQVDFYGFVSNPYKILSCSKMMIMTSRYEGTPMCVLEGQSLGLPVISTPTDGVKDIIINDKNGFLSDKDEKLVDKIIEILNDNNKYKKMSKSSAECFDKYNDIVEYMKKLECTYR